MAVALVLAAALAAAVLGLRMTEAAPSGLGSGLRSGLLSGAKTLPLAAGALAAWLWGAPGALVAGLGLGALGELALSRAGEGALKSGIAALVAANLAWLALFAGLAETPLAGWRLVAAGGVVAWAAAGYWAIQPRLEALSLPVAVHVGTLAAMAGASLLTDLPPAWLGAGLLLLSDSLRAAALFFGPGGSGTAAWAGRVAAQACIAWGVTAG